MGKDEETDLIKFFVTSIKMAEKKQKWPLNVTRRKRLRCASVLDIRFSLDVRCSMFDVHLSKLGNGMGLREKCAFPLAVDSCIKLQYADRTRI
jgi:hypothetical protein